MLAQICSNVGTNEVCVYVCVFVYTRALNRGNKGGMKNRGGK